MAVIKGRDFFYFNIYVNNPVVLGKLGSAYGILGWLRFFSSTEKAEDVFKYQPWFIQRFTQWQRLELEDWKYHNQDIIVKIKNINDRGAANSIVNYEINVGSEQLPALKSSDEYYWKDLIGCRVITITGYSLGHVYNLMKTGANDVLLIKANLKNAFGIKELLIPFLNDQVIKNVDLVTKVIEVDWNPDF